MRKRTVFILTLILLIAFSASAAASPAKFEHQIADESVESTFTMAINKNFAVANGVQREITSPILALNKTYVDLYSMAPLFEYGVQWIEDQISFFRIEKNGLTVDFNLISQWDDLINLENKFFIKDDKIFVSLRELAAFCGAVVFYESGYITVGGKSDLEKEMYGDIDEYDVDDYIYKTYPCWAQYVVNPYQAYSYENMLTDAKALERMYPEIINVSSIGQSVENRELLLIEFGRGSNRVFVCGTHHAREYMATTYLMYAIDRYAYAYRTNSMWGKYSPKDILDNITFCIVPMVNPDGVNLVQNGLYSAKNPNEIANMGIYEGSHYGYAAWKANVNGVDVNWNYDKDWNVKRNKNNRGSTGFNGIYPNSEPETAAVANYVDQNAFDAYLSFHTQGQIFYWADNEANPSYINQAVQKDTGFIGYRDSGTGVGGSFFDYVYRNFKKPTITVELCPYVGDYPYPNNDFDRVWKPAKNILLVVGNEIIYKKTLN